MKFVPSTVHSSNFNVTLYNSGANRTVHFVAMHGVSFNITNLNGSEAWLRENSSLSMHVLVLGSTDILAIDYKSYEVAVLSVEV